MILIAGKSSLPLPTCWHKTHRIVLAPAFAGIHCFPEGRGFKQRMGDDPKALMKVNHIYYYYNLWFLYCSTDVFICHWGSCPRRDGIGHAGLYWLLLHHKMGYPWHAQSWNTQSCPWMLSLAPGYLWRVQHLNKGFQSTMSTFDEPGSPLCLLATHFCFSDIAYWAWLHHCDHHMMQPTMWTTQPGATWSPMLARSTTIGPWSFWS